MHDKESSFLCRNCLHYRADEIICRKYGSESTFSCFEAKSRRRRGDDEDAAHKRKAFRVCICEDHVQRLLDPSVWLDSIVISEWFFKQSTRNVQNTVDKRRRIGSGERDDRQARQSTLVQSRSQSAAHCITTGMYVDADQDVVTTAEHSGSSDIARHNDDAIDEGERTVVVSDDTILTAINT